MGPCNENHKWLSLKKKRQLDLLLKLTQKPDREDLQQKISPFENHTDTELVKIFSLFSQYQKSQSNRDFQFFCQYIERLCNASVAETEFLVRTEDRKMQQLPRHPLRIIVEDLRSSFNVGAIFRTADCLRVDHLYLTGYTATPHNNGTQKAALGADTSVPWTYHPNVHDSINKARSDGFTIWGLETSDVASPLFNSTAPKKVALLLGNERFGIRPETLRLCDQMIEIPTFGQKNSLNVSHCIAISGYELVRQWNS